MNIFVFYVETKYIFIGNTNNNNCGTKLMTTIYYGGAKEKKNKKQGTNAEKHKPVNNETLNDQK